MYLVYANDVCIYKDDTPMPNLKLINPKLSLADSAAGSFECTIPPGNAGYSLIERLTTDITVYADKMAESNIIWAGRVIKDEYDFWNRRKIFCEGELAFLNDTIQPPKEFLVENTTCQSFLTTIINEHNSKVAKNRQFSVGMVTMTDNIHRYTNYDSTLECVNEKLVNNLGGHIRVRHEGGLRKIDYLKDYPTVESQSIEFGKNLLDFSKNFDVTDLITVVIPKGARKETQKIENLDDYVTIADVNGGKNYLESSAVSTYGRIEGVVEWNDVNEPQILKTKAENYIKDLQFDKMVLEITAVDLHMLNPNIKRIGMLSQVTCNSPAHGMVNKLFPVTKMEIPLDQPDNCKYTLGTDESQTLTAITHSNLNSINEEIAKIPSQNQILKAAKKNALEILNGTAEGGYVVFDMKDSNNPNRITGMSILNGPTDDQSTAKWVWTSGGFGYMKRVKDPKTGKWGNWQTADVPIAMTMDGKLVADYITSGCIKLGGVAKTDETAADPSLTYLEVYDIDGNRIGYWDQSGIHASKGEFSGVFSGSVNASQVNAGTLTGMKVQNKEGTYYINLTGDGNTVAKLPGFIIGNSETENAINTTRIDMDHGSTSTIAGYTCNANFGSCYFDHGGYRSDRKLKKNIKKLDISKSKALLNIVKPKQFIFKRDDENKIRYGVIAQDLKNSLSELGEEFENSGFVNLVDDKAMLGKHYVVDYVQFIPHLINVVKDQQKRIEALERSK